MRIGNILENLSPDELRQLHREMLRRGVVGTSEFPFQEKDKILIRTVTHYWLGAIKHIGPDYLTLENASWVADTGRFHEVLVKGVDDPDGLQRRPEIEPAPGNPVVMRAAIVDICPWMHNLPSEVI